MVLFISIFDFMLCLDYAAIGGLLLANDVTKLTKWPLVLPALLTVLSQVASVRAYASIEGKGGLCLLRQTNEL